MSLFKRPAPMAEFVLTPDGWRPAQEFMLEEWRRLAATAWEGYQSSGRGLVAIDLSTGSIDVVPVEDFLAFLHERGKHGLLDSETTIRQLHEQCSRYMPDREIVLELRGARNTKAART